MWCPECDGGTKTIDSRKYQDVSGAFDFVRRNRICRVCSHKFITIEVSQEIWDNYHNKEEQEVD
jgi:transcriptional regulator NrdR family protein